MSDFNPIEPSPARKQTQAIVKCGFFLLGTSATAGLFLLLTRSNLMGFRGAPREENPFAHPNKAAADLIVLGILTAVVTVLTIYRAEKNLHAAFVAGMWAGISIGLVLIAIEAFAN